MISLKKSMDALEQMHSRSQASMDSYVRVLSALASAAEVMVGDEGGQLREDLKGILLMLNAQAAPQVIKQSSEQSEKAVRKLAELVNKKESDYQQIIRVVAEAGAAMIQSGSSHSEQLKRFAAQIDSVSRLDTIAEVRKQLVNRVSELKDIAGRIREEGQLQASKLEEELHKVQAKLEAAQTLAETDALTGLGNRRMAENAIKTAIGSGLGCALILFDLNGFKAINDTYGHQQGDQLLKAIANQMKESVRDSDVVCRWGGDEFVIILTNAELEAVEETAIRIQAGAFGDFVINHAAENVWVSVAAEFGVAQHRYRETAVEFFERADQILYERKSKRSARGK